MFIAAAKRQGWHDRAELDDARRKALAWLSTNFPRMVLDHFNEEICLGCKLEANGVNLNEIEYVISEFSRTLDGGSGRKASEIAPILKP
jgi:hypothetical protein